MKRLLSVLLVVAGLFAFSAHAQAVNNRTFTIDPFPPPAQGVTQPTEWRVYCGTSPDTTTWNKATGLVKTVLLPALTTGVVPLPDTYTHCAATSAGGTGIESAYSNVVYAKPLATPVIKITMKGTIQVENLVDGSSQQYELEIRDMRVTGVSVR